MAVYCTRTDLINRASADAADLRLDDDPTDDTTMVAMTATIDDASAEIDLYLDERYDQATYATNRWVKYACVTIALYFLCQRRLESVPKSAKDRYDALIKMLTRIHDGEMKVPGLGERKQSAPVLSIPRVLLAPYPRVVRERQQSTGNPQGYPPKDDPTEPPLLP